MTSTVSVTPTDVVAAIREGHNTLGTLAEALGVHNSNSTLRHVLFDLADRGDISMTVGRFRVLDPS